MKILILSDDFPPNNLGGAGIIAFNLAKAFNKMGHTLLVVTTVQDKDKEGVTEYEGLEIHRIYSNYHDRWRAYISLYNPQTVKEVRKIIKEFEPDIVHAHNVHSHLSYACLKVAKKSGAKVFLTAHDVMLFHYGKLVEYINPKELYCPNKFNYKLLLCDRNVTSSPIQFVIYENFSMNIIMTDTTKSYQIRIFIISFIPI